MPALVPVKVRHSSLIVSPIHPDRMDGESKKAIILTNRFIKFTRGWPRYAIFLKIGFYLCPMAGIYFHIPFCKQACHYCDFHFSTSLKYRGEMLAAMEKEISLQTGYLDDKRIESIYFGGGTPSLLEVDDLSRLMDAVALYFDILPDVEITLEANPDDLDGRKVLALRRTPVNRFSIGIQSFFEEDLRWMNRAHNAIEARKAIQRVQ